MNKPQTLFNFFDFCKKFEYHNICRLKERQKFLTIKYRQERSLCKVYQEELAKAIALLVDTCVLHEG